MELGNCKPTVVPIFLISLLITNYENYTWEIKLELENSLKTVKGTRLSSRRKIH